MSAKLIHSYTLTHYEYEIIFDSRSEMEICSHEKLENIAKQMITGDRGVIVEGRAEVNPLTEGKFRLLYQYILVKNTDEYYLNVRSMSRIGRGAIDLSLMKEKKSREKCIIS